MKKQYNIIIIIIQILLIIIFNGCIDLSQDNHTKIITVDANGNYDYIKIQDAINDSLDNGTIFVNIGIYNENIIINKNLHLIGEDKNNTIIDGNKIGDVIYISESNSVSISGFTIKNSGIGSPNYDSAVDIRSSFNIVKDNIITDNNNGILLFFSNYNNISNNQFLNSSEYGIYVYSSTTNDVSDNIFLSNNYGLKVRGSRHLNINRNIFYNNERGIDLCCGSLDNLIYDNIFSNNTLFNAQDSVGSNYWDYEKSGNYWDDYNLSDDKGYVISISGIDNYPIKNLTDISWYENYFDIR